MAIKPILFNTEMVRAILEGRKTVTRRVIKPQPDSDYEAVKGMYRDGKGKLCAVFHSSEDIKSVYPNCDRGDILYVRETWTPVPDGSYIYKASVECPDAWCGTWRPSIHMPREAARIFLRVTGVHVERLQELSLKDAEREGIDPREPMFTKFVEVWNKTVQKHPNKFKRYPYQWDENPWVWVIEFERCDRPGDWK